MSSNATQSSTPAVTVVGPQFTAASTLDLLVTKNSKTLSDGWFTVTDTDVNGTVMCKVKGSNNLKIRRSLLDNAGNAVISFRPKTWSLHLKWSIFRGKSFDAKDLIFSVKKSSIIQFKTTLDVFLASNIKEEVPDFKVKEEKSTSWTIYLGDTSTIIAQVKRKQSFKDSFFGQDAYLVTVYPNVDYAFIVTLVVIIYENIKPNGGGGGGGGDG